ncbi:MAG: N-acetylmuramoyl-L-alanine amidase [Luteolibacter sp.]
MKLTTMRSMALLIPLLVAAVVWLWWQNRAPNDAAPPQSAKSPTLSTLGRVPDWKSLEAHQESMTRDEFERLLTTIFASGEAWRRFVNIGENEAQIRTTDAADAETFVLRFAKQGAVKKPSRWWLAPEDLPPPTDGKPLDGLHIAIDPGHIGGAWARVEERWFDAGDGHAVCEGDLTLQVANRLKPQLESLGARVTLVREKTEPVTTWRPEALIETARQSSDQSTAPDSPEALRKLAERLFYRTAEIHARAELVNESIKPDLVLCLHFNAEAWGDPNQPTLIDRSHFHILINGAYSDEELRMADHRFAMFDKLLSRSHEEEISIGSKVADVFARQSGLPPYTYPATSTNALPVSGQPYLWARNLLANRLYQCPVIFMEPYVMNSITDHARLKLGDYEGTRDVNGTQRISIIREYADALAEGLKQAYAERRTVTNQ